MDYELFKLCGFVRNVPIRTLGDLGKVIRVADANVKDGTIVETGNDLNATSFAVLTMQVSRPDFVSVDFKCTKCGSVFHLRCETYHGRGGTWSPA